MNLKDQLQTMAKGKNASYSAIADYLLARKSYAGLKLMVLSAMICAMRSVVLSLMTIRVRSWLVLQVRRRV